MRHMPGQHAVSTYLMLGALCLSGCGDSLASYASYNSSVGLGEQGAMGEQPGADAPGELMYVESTEPGAPLAAVGMSDFDCELGVDGVLIDAPQVPSAFGAGAVSCAMIAPADGVDLFWDGSLPELWIRTVRGASVGPWTSVVTLDAESSSHRGTKFFGESVDRLDVYVVDSSMIQSLFINLAVDGAPGG